MQAFNQDNFAPFETLDQVPEHLHEAPIPKCSKCIVCAIPFLSYESNYIKTRMNEKKGNKESYEDLAQGHSCDLPDCIRKYHLVKITSNVCSDDGCIDTYMARVFDAHNNEKCFEFKLEWDP